MNEISFVGDILLPVLALAATTMLGLLAWLGSRLHSKVDQIPRELEAINHTLHQIEVDLRRELATHDARISVVEARVDMMRGAQ